MKSKSEFYNKIPLQCSHSYLPCKHNKHINVNAVNVNITMGFMNLNETMMMMLRSLYYKEELHYTN
jgi:hypothetical protein